MARTKSYTAIAVLVFFLYWIFWLPGFIMNLTYYKEASRVEEIAGESLPGVGCLWVMLQLNVLAIVLGVIAALVAIVFLNSQ